MAVKLLLVSGRLVKASLPIPWTGIIEPAPAELAASVTSVRARNASSLIMMCLQFGYCSELTTAREAGYSHTLKKNFIATYSLSGVGSNDAKWSPQCAILKALRFG